MLGEGERWTGRGRAPFQVLVLPFRRAASDILYAVFKRADAGYWQFIAGGGEDDELPIEAARRESWEEAGILKTAHFAALDSRHAIPVIELAGHLLWGPQTLVVPEYTFGVAVDNPTLRISPEHTEYRWIDRATCHDLLHWQSNREALAELDWRIRHGMIPGPTTSERDTEAAKGENQVD